MTTGTAKPPVWYGRLLEREREATGLSRKDFAEKSGIDYVKILRNEIGHKDRSGKGSNEIREALMALGRTVLPVPIGDVPEPDVVVSSRLEEGDEIVRANLVKFRHALEWDVHTAADAAKLSVDELQAYELGERVPSPSVVGKIADAYGCNRGAFYDKSDALPKFDTSRHPAFQFGGRAAHLLTDEEREILARISTNVSAREKAGKAVVKARVVRTQTKKRRSS